MAILTDAFTLRKLICKENHWIFMVVMKVEEFVKTVVTTPRESIVTNVKTDFTGLLESTGMKQMFVNVSLYLKRLTLN